MAREKLFSTTELDAVSPSELRNLVSAWAAKELRLVNAAAARDRRISEFQNREQERYNAEFGALECDATAEKARITSIIQHHAGWFPEGARSVTIDNAEYGYRKGKPVTDVRPESLEEFKQFADDNGYDLYKYKISPVKSAVKKLLDSGVDVPGAYITQGETAFVNAFAENTERKLKGK